MSQPSRIWSLSTWTLGRALALLGAAACTESPNAPNVARLVPSVVNAASTSISSAAFADGASDNLRSDGRGTYFDGVDCVNSTLFAGSKPYQLRTIRNEGVCKAQIRPAWRFFTFALGAAVVDLDQDHLIEAIEDAPARLGAEDAFARGATSTPVTIFIMEVLANGSTTENFKWTLLYRNNVPVSGSGVRVIQALAGSATVDIYVGAVDPRRPKADALVATIDLPFKLTLTP